MASGVADRLDIAIVENHDETRAQLEALASRAGYHVAAFGDPATALAAFRISAPRMVVVELLLPVMDGFELCQIIRGEMDPAIAILCITGVSWGQRDLKDIVLRRLRATLLRKPFPGSAFLKELGTQIGQPRPRARAPTETNSPARPAQAGKQPAQLQPRTRGILGSAEAQRAEKLTRLYENGIASAALHATPRRHVRFQSEFVVQFKNLGEFVSEYTRNISAGGLFIKTDRPPPVHQVIDLRLVVPHVGRTIEVSAKVVHSVGAADAVPQGTEPGFGVQFVAIKPEDRKLLESLCQELLKLKAATPPRSEEAKRELWIVLLGLAPQWLLQFPSFAHRDSVNVLSFRSLREAEDFLAVHRVHLCLVGDAIFEGADPRAAMTEVVERLHGQTQKLVVTDRAECAEWIAQGLCQVIVSPIAPAEDVLKVIQARLGAAGRRSPRVSARTSVRVTMPGAEFSGHMINLSIGGVLLRTEASCGRGTFLRLEFNLPREGRIDVSGRVVRSQRAPEARESLVGVEFVDLSTESREALRRFVQSQINFGEFFGWLKKTYFSPESPGDAANGSDPKPRQRHNIFGLDP